MGTCLRALIACGGGGFWGSGQARHKRADRGRDVGASGGSGGWGGTPTSKTAPEESPSGTLVISSITLDEDMLHYTTQRSPLLCEYVCQRRQQGVKRCERVSGLDF